MAKENHKEGIIEKIEDKAKEIGGEIKEVVKDVVEKVEEGIEKVEEEVKEVVQKIEGKKEEKVPAKEKPKKETKKPHSKNNPIKDKAVKALAEKIKKAKTLMIVSIRGLPSRQFQSIKKSIREHAAVQVAKKNIMIKAIKAVGKPSILDLENHIQENFAFVISDMEGYELAGILAQKKNPVYAKAGQEAPEDIEVKAGPTDLVPGPAISELGSLGLQVAVEDGKISIKSDKIVITKGGEINEGAASILQKLNIQPFTVGLEPIAIYDIESEKIYTDVKIDSEEAAENLKSAAGKALGFAQKIVYFCKDTIGYFLAKANANSNALEKLAPAEEKPEEKKEEAKAEEAPKEEAKAEEKPVEEKKEEPEVKEEAKEDTQTKSEEEK